MKLPDFNHAKMEWDSWRAFHVEHKYNTFVQFDTGEFVVCYNRWAPDHRKLYQELHLQVTATDDKDCPRLFLPHNGKPVPKSHLNHKGQQMLLLDHDHKRAVSLERWFNDDNAPPLIPGRFVWGNHSNRNVAAYYAGPNAMPHGAMPITRHFPHPLTPEQRKHLRELKDACEVWLKMKPDTEQAALTKAHREVKAPLVAEFIDVSFSMLTLEHRAAIAMRGYNMIAEETNPWLTFESSLVFEKFDDDNQETDTDD